MYDSNETLKDLSDINFAIIKAISDSFISRYGNLSVETGLPVLNAENNNDVTIEKEISIMLLQPELGIRQVVPLIAMWLVDFDLTFDDPLYKMEFMRLQQRQVLADQLENVVQFNRKVSIQFSVAEILSMLEPDELFESLPYIEHQIYEELPKKPETIEDLFERVRALWQYSSKFIEIQLTPDMVQKKDVRVEASDLLQEAKIWLNKTQKETKYNLNAFFKAYEQLEPDFKKAVSQVLDDNLKKSQKGLPSHVSKSYGEDFNLFKTLINRILKWFQTS